MSAPLQKSLRASIGRYATKLRAEGIHPSKFILFGSFAKGEEHEWSDIDLVVVAPELEPPRTNELTDRLWYATIDSDNRIEPIACGEKEWENGSNRLILEVARGDGIAVDVLDLEPTSSSR